MIENVDCETSSLFTGWSGLCLGQAVTDDEEEEEEEQEQEEGEDNCGDESDCSLATKGLDRHENA
eukprot:CAMPEP_0114348864 /NCGR_PEP_ID=MMETSP0101-20121206/15066_1 /TAXON_ID=38822 ORGANISM="Pteridomonas danica, Strain PT" /NCGR_SAMPLE_ID=MMETSP0101 /ASSEMBLY_ACC=CAM_ASM_000211 /LENGTH=64 /DNA_ID=CAMNT_0001487079 /DNA_START=257 /DNA_END=451 /DNA_ORIENTATION=+